MFAILPYMSILQVLCWHQYVVKPYWCKCDAGIGVEQLPPWAATVSKDPSKVWEDRWESVFPSDSMHSSCQRWACGIRVTMWGRDAFHVCFLTNWSSSGHPLRPKSSKMSPCCDTSTILQSPFQKFSWSSTEGDSSTKPLSQRNGTGTASGNRLTRRGSCCLEQRGC